PVAGREQRPVDRNREEERRSRDELLAVEVPAPRARRPRRVHAPLPRRHPEHPEERRQRNLAALEVTADRRVGVQLPREHPALTLADTEPVVQRRRPAAGDAPPERADAYLL